MCRVRIYGNKGMHLSPKFSGNPIIKLRFCKAWPEAPFTRLSICKHSFTRSGINTTINKVDIKKIETESTCGTYNRYDYCSPWDAIRKDVYMTTIGTLHVFGVWSLITRQHRYKFFFLQTQQHEEHKHVILIWQFQPIYMEKGQLRLYFIGKGKMAWCVFKCLQYVLDCYI